jgi:hypothetical protein
MKGQNMRVIELSEFRDEDGIISLENRVKGTLEYGLAWFGDMQAQEEVSHRLDKSLGVEHLLIRNVPIPNTDIIIPLVLISPQGVRVLYPSRIRGIYRAKGDEWQTFDGRTRRFKKKRPNLQMIVLSLASSLLEYLQEQGFPLPEVEAVLLFTNPRTHVDTASPQTRIVLGDAFDHFAGNLQDLQAIMDLDDINMIADLLENPKSAEAEELDSGEYAQGVLAELDADLPEAGGEFFPEETLKPMQTRPELAKRPSPVPIWTIGRFQLTRNQWIVLGVLVFFEIVILIAFAFIIYSETFLQ